MSLFYKNNETGDSYEIPIDKIVIIGICVPLIMNLFGIVDLTFTQCCVILPLVYDVITIFAMKKIIKISYALKERNKIKKASDEVKKFMALYDYGIHNMVDEKTMVKLLKDKKILRCINKKCVANHADDISIEYFAYKISLITLVYHQSFVKKEMNKSQFDRLTANFKNLKNLNNDKLAEYEKTAKGILDLIFENLKYTATCSEIFEELKMELLKEEIVENILDNFSKA